MFVQQLINGLALGSVYALIALGYTMVYGILQLINLAHGEVYMLGAYLGIIVLGVLTSLGVTASHLTLALLLTTTVSLLFCAAMAPRSSASGIAPSGMPPSCPPSSVRSDISNNPEVWNEDIGEE